MHVVIVAGSNMATELAPELLGAADLLVAVDGGADALARVGVVPGLLVGDLDSISPGIGEALEAQGVEVVVLPTAKDETDTQAALRLVVDRGATDITVFGGLGGPRLDHLVGNLLLLSSPWLAGVGVRLVDDLHEAFLAKRDVVFGGRQGDMVSLLPLTPLVENVRTEGMAYPLAGESLFQSATRGVSNAMTGPEARVTHGEGVLLVIHYRGR
jgi:thiamine pyrophosphokinase